MLNIEKYENELRKYGTYFALTKEGKLVSCDGLCCRNCAFNANCSIKRMNWLLEEYKEPILTDKEKTYLKNVIEPRKKDVVDITKWKFYKEKDIEYFTVIILMKNPHTNLCMHLLDFITTEDMPFENLELYKHYTIEELGL